MAFPKSGCVICGAAANYPQVILHPLPNGGFICNTCILIMKAPPQIVKCPKCGNATTPGKPCFYCQAAANQAYCYHCGLNPVNGFGSICSACTMVQQQKAAARQARARPSYGINFGSGGWKAYSSAPDPVAEPKISAESAHWKQNLEQLGMPWNFYESLVVAAKALANDDIDSAFIDKDGWLNLRYQTYTVRMKITEITVEPPK